MPHEQMASIAQRHQIHRIQFAGWVDVNRGNVMDLEAFPYATRFA